MRSTKRISRAGWAFLAALGVCAAVAPTASADTTLPASQANPGRCRNTTASARPSDGASASACAPMRMEFGRMRPMSMLNASLRQKFLNDRASVTVRVSDPLNRMRFGMITERDYDAELDLPGYTLDTERRFGARALFISFSYNFGQTPRLRTPRPQDQPQVDPSQTGAPMP